MVRSVKISWVKWDLILNSKVDEGLEIGSLGAFNMALLYKWRWRLLTGREALVRVIKVLHGDAGEFSLHRSFTGFGLL